MIRALSWPRKTIVTLREEGFEGLQRKTKILSEEFSYRWKKARYTSERDSFYDVLFINGCGPSVPHPPRYRVEHQAEQLEANGLSTDSVFYDNLTVDDVRRARSFVFFRCPYTETVGAFIKKAKELNKRVFFDIDDLVIDTKYTDNIKYLGSMPAQEREWYDQGVRAMGKTLQLCDAAITTTEALAKELRNYVPEVFINRNTASEEMLALSQDAVYVREILPTLSKEHVPQKYRTAYRELMLRPDTGTTETVSIGYFSGSITHNDDFEYILPALIRTLEARPQARLCIAGELDLPPELEPYRNRIEAVPFASWKKLPEMISRTDISIAPLTESLFNEAKSENKWVEASLVKVPTIASDIGAFSRMVEQGITGFLCTTVDEWYDSLITLIDNADLRRRVAESAYEFCMANCLTINSGYRLAEFIREKQTPNIALVVPSLNTSGGILVVLKHCTLLQDAGYDVMILNADDDYLWYEYEDHSLPVLNRIKTLGHYDDTPIRGQIDKGVATFWDTLAYLERYPKIKETFYLVQGYETDFYAPSSPLRKEANATYSKDVIYLTISQWCKGWLTKDFMRNVRFASNGIDLSRFWPKEREFNGKIRILIEGDFSAHKNVDESFRIVERLDPEKYEIWYMSYMPRPKSFYRIDNFLGAVPHEEVADVYRNCHILLKTSILESFSFPPLEMMATGGFVVVLPNEGNMGYLRDGYNCLLFERENHDQAIEAITRISDDAELRSSLYQGGLETASRYEWEYLREEICRLYETEQLSIKQWLAREKQEQCNFGI